MFLQLYASVSTIAPYRRILRVQVDGLRVQVCSLIELVVCSRRVMAVVSHNEDRSRAHDHALKNALFASALSRAASAFASSEGSGSELGFKTGVPGADVGGVDEAGVDKPDEDEELMVVGVQGGIDPDRRVEDPSKSVQRMMHR